MRAYCLARCPLPARLGSAHGLGSGVGASGGGSGGGCWPGRAPAPARNATICTHNKHANVVLKAARQCRA